MRKKNLIALLAILGAMFVPSAVAFTGTVNAALWFLGGFGTGIVFDRAVLGAQPVRAHQLPVSQVGVIYCPAGWVAYDRLTNQCFVPTKQVVPQVALATGQCALPGFTWSTQYPACTRHLTDVADIQKVSPDIDNDLACKGKPAGFAYDVAIPGGIAHRKCGRRPG